MFLPPVHIGEPGLCDGLSDSVLAHDRNRYRKRLILYPYFVSRVPTVLDVLIMPGKHKGIAYRYLVE